MTLIELLVILGVIMILMCLTTPSLGRARESARRSACQSNVRQIGLAFNQYAVDNDGRFPTNGNPSITPGSCLVFQELTNGNYLAVGKIYVCPSEYWKGTPPTTGFSRLNNSYSCVSVNPIGTVPLTDKHVGNPLILDRGLDGAPGYVAGILGNHWLAGSPHKSDGGNVFFVGGHAAFEKFLGTSTNGTKGYVLEP